MNQDRDAIHWRGCSSEVRYCPSLTNAAGLRRYGLDLETSPLDWINTSAFQRLFLLASLPLGALFCFACLAQHKPCCYAQRTAA